MKKELSIILLFLLVIPGLAAGVLLAPSQNLLLNTTEDPQENPGSDPEIDQISREPVQPSKPSNVVIRESAVYDAAKGDERPIVHFEGLIYWEELAGSPLNFFINTSDVINSNFENFETGEEYEIRNSCSGPQGTFIQGCVVDNDDRYLIVPDGRSFIYTIDAYYDPDIVEDTGFIVIFNSQTVDFRLQVDEETVYANVDYSNKIVLPKGAALVSYAPKQQPFGKTDDGRYFMEWEYINRQMDSRHDPLLISVTYNFDDIFLAFTEQVYQNQQEQQERQDQINRLNLIQQSFVIIATFAILASLFSILFAYLLARRKFEPELEKAKELPRREASDIEESESLQVPIKSMFLSAMILVPALMGPTIPMIGGNPSQIGIQQGMEPNQINPPDSKLVHWDGTMDLGPNNIMVEKVSITLPVSRDNVYIYANTSNPDTDLVAYNQFGSVLQVEEDDNRYVIQNPGFKFRYELTTPYEVANNEGMFTFLDRFWIEYTKPNDSEINPNDPYFNVSLRYSILLPKGSILYSASPSDRAEITTSIGGRTNITFTDKNRRMDAFHDPWETQVTYSNVSVLEALENIESDFEQLKAEEQDLNSLLEVAAQEVLLFSLLGLIAPLISFIIAYWVFRRRYKKKIDRAEKEQEERIFIEAPQIQALTKATDKDAQNNYTDAYQGHFYRFMAKLSSMIDKDATRLEDSTLLSELDRNEIQVDRGDVMQVISMGKSIEGEDTIGYEQLMGFYNLVEEVLDEINRRN